MSYNAADPVQIKEAGKTQRRKETKREGVLKQLMQSEDGREWMFEILSMCHMFQTSFHQNALGMAFAEGERNIGLRLYADLTRTVPQLYLRMIEERANDGRRADDTSASEQRTDASASSTD